MAIPLSTLKIVAICCLVTCLGLVAWRSLHGGRTAVLRIAFLDVGQGDAAVIETPGGRVIVLDAGGGFSDSGSDRGHTVLEPYLRSHGVRHIDAIVLTHPHLDHIGGADTLINDFPTGLLIDNGEPTVPPQQEHILQDAERRHVTHRIAVRGQQMDLGDGIKAEVLGPTPEEVRADKANNASVVLKITYGKTRFLFMGDAEKAEENDLLGAHIPIACDVLKVGHHGSSTSSTPAFVDAAHPRDAVISVGADNRYGHPSEDVVARLQSKGTRILRTDKAGAVICESDGEVLKFSTMRHMP